MTALRELTADEINTLAGIITKLRPHGAPRWQPAGVRAAFVKVAHLDAANVLAAAIRLACDRTAQTPAQIGIPASECWREKPSDWTPPPTPHDPVNSCDICGKRRHECQAIPETISGHRYTSAAHPDRQLAPDEAADVLEDLRDRARPPATTHTEAPTTPVGASRFPDEETPA